MDTANNNQPCCGASLCSHCCCVNINYYNMFLFDLEDHSLSSPTSTFYEKSRCLVAVENLSPQRPPLVYGTESERGDYPPLSLSLVDFILWPLRQHFWHWSLVGRGKEGIDCLSLPPFSPPPPNIPQITITHTHSFSLSPSLLLNFQQDAPPPPPPPPPASGPLCLIQLGERRVLQKESTVLPSILIYSSAPPPSPLFFWGGGGTLLPMLLYLWRRRVQKKEQTFYFYSPIIKLVCGGGGGGVNWLQTVCITLVSVSWKVGGWSSQYLEDMSTLCLSLSANKLSRTVVWLNQRAKFCLTFYVYCSDLCPD